MGSYREEEGRLDLRGTCAEVKNHAAQRPTLSEPISAVSRSRNKFWVDSNIQSSFNAIRLLLYLLLFCRVAIDGALTLNVVVRYYNVGAMLLKKT